MQRGEGKSGVEEERVGRVEGSSRASMRWIKRQRDGCRHHLVEMREG